MYIVAHLAASLIDKKERLDRNTQYIDHNADWTAYAECRKQKSRAWQVSCLSNNLFGNTGVARPFNTGIIQNS